MAAVIIDAAAFLALALQCSPTVAPDTLLAVARQESGLHAWLLRDNTTKDVVEGRDLEQTAGVAEALIAARHSVDIGLMQINSRNLAFLGLSVAAVLKPCGNVAAGGRVLMEAYAVASRRVGPGAEALRIALSRYNTGDDQAGLRNGYVGQVEQRAAAYVVPSLVGSKQADSDQAAMISAAGLPIAAGQPQVGSFMRRQFGDHVAAAGAVEGTAISADAFARRPRDLFAVEGRQ
ncbi:MAG: lytic transglycosylase domain-containing protein [Proteobacteria bacterium]|nr:lytic transglycosylase domain-containing protein [Pseudomonadota bacterium]